MTADWRRLAGVVALAASVGASAAQAQLVGVPVLQNAFANPGFTAGANVGVQDGARTYAGALTWAPGNGRAQVSAGAGVLDTEGAPLLGDGDPNDRTYNFTWGLRGAYSLLERAGGTVGVGAFVGIGGVSHDRASQLGVPVGASLGWRRALGETRAISLYLTPFYSYTELRFDRSGLDCDSPNECPPERESDGALRVAAGVDVALTSAIGVTVGYEVGQRAVEAAAGREDVFGLAVSFAFGARR